MPYPPHKCGFLLVQEMSKSIKNDFEGEITSGTFSPFMKKSIGIARVPFDVNEDANVLIRNKLLKVRILSLPFVRKGKIII